MVNGLIGIEYYLTVFYFFGMYYIIIKNYAKGINYA